MNENKNIQLEPTTQYRDYEAEIIDIIRSDLSPKEIKTQILMYHENDIEAAISTLSAEERKKLLNIIGVDTYAKILEYSENIDEYLSELTLKKRVPVISKLETTIAAQYLESLEELARENIISLLDNETKEEIYLLNSFDDDEIGSRMTTNYISIQENLSIRQATKEVIKQAADNDNISKIYIVDEDDIFVGAIELKDLIIARDTTDLSSIILTSYPYVYTYELIENCIERIKEYSEDSIPVLDQDNKLCGVIISQDVIELLTDEMNEDYAKLAGLSSKEDLNEPIFKSVKKRLPWLIVLLGLGLIVSAVVSVFESIVTHLAVIVSFQSLILGMSGNVGTQSLAVTIRVLMDEELYPQQKFSFIFKEAKIGFINGIILGALSFFLVGGYLILLKNQPHTFAFSVSSCTALALIVAIFLSSISGTIIPILFKKLKIDPAVASGPLITTINDLVAVVSYYGLSWLLLISLLKY